TNGHCNILSDMFSLGLVICAVFNNGKPLIQANNNPMLYVKQIEFVALIFGITGACRRQELNNITTKDIENHGEMLLVKIPNTKNKIPRSFTIHGPFYEIVKKYESLRSTKGKSDRFFQNFQNGKCTSQPIGVNKFGSMPREIAKFLGLPQADAYTGHSFRRTSATLLANSGADILTLKRHGGWRSNNVAESYIEDSIQNKADISAKITQAIHLEPQSKKFCPEPRPSTSYANDDLGFHTFANDETQCSSTSFQNLDQQVSAVLPRVPAALQEAVQRCQSEQAIQAMQFLDVITMKDPNQKANFYRVTLIDALPYIPKMEVRTAEVLAAVLQPVIWLTNEAAPDEFSHYVLPTLKNLMNSPKSVQASVTILENLHIILKKCQKEEVNNEIMPILYAAMDNNTNQIQTASLIAMQNVSDYIEDKALHGIVLGKVKVLLEKNQSDVKIISLILGFYEKILLRLERNHILEQVIPTLLSMRLSDPDIINRVVRLYKSMLLERKFGLTTNVMATKMIPSLAPQTVNPALNVDQFTNLMEILYDMLDNIDKNQRYKLKLDSLSLPSPDRHRTLRHQMSTDNMNVPPFNIPNLRVEQRKTSSAEDMARKNSMSGPSGTGSVGGGFKSTGIGQWFFGSSNSTNHDGNFLRVASAFPNRRLSDNTLMTPKIRIAPSCASSPGGTPGGNSGLPTRRHSSIGPQERRGSAVNLSPPTGYQYRGRGGSGSSLSVPSASQCVVSDVHNVRLPGYVSSLNPLLNVDMERLVILMWTIIFCGRWVNAEYIVECAVPTDVVNAVDPVAAAVSVSQRLARLGHPAAAEQRH
ncbi:hypothetical protein MSG28_001036, partial [Choristoneura fumiferana]